MAEKWTWRQRLAHALIVYGIMRHYIVGYGRWDALRIAVREAYRHE